MALRGFLAWISLKSIFSRAKLTALRVDMFFPLCCAAWAGMKWLPCSAAALAAVHLVLGRCYFWTAGCTSTLWLFYSCRSTMSILKMAGRDGCLDQVGDPGSFKVMDIDVKYQREANSCLLRWGLWLCCACVLQRSSLDKCHSPLSGIPSTGMRTNGIEVRSVVEHLSPAASRDILESPPLLRCRKSKLWYQAYLVDLFWFVFPSDWNAQMSSHKHTVGGCFASVV